MSRFQNNPSIGWMHLKSTHACPLAWGNNNTIYSWSWSDTQMLDTLWVGCKFMNSPNMEIDFTFSTSILTFLWFLNMAPTIKTWWMFLIYLGENWLWHQTFALKIVCFHPCNISNWLVTTIGSSVDI
jgi:hypothetical protein